MAIHTCSFQRFRFFNFKNVSKVKNSKIRNFIFEAFVSPSIMEDASLLHQVAKQERQIQELKSQKGILKDMHDVTKHKLAAVEISVKQAEAELETSDQVISGVV
jgi:hypothetical protein